MLTTYVLSGANLTGKIKKIKSTVVIKCYLKKHELESLKRIFQKQQTKNCVNEITLKIKAVLNVNFTFKSLSLRYKQK